MIDVPVGSFYLGSQLSADDQPGAPFFLKADDLTTHAVIVGMTGSGKTGLGMILLEEALCAGLPVMAIDPKGDMGDLLLQFPDDAPAEYVPWVDPRAAAAAGRTAEELAAEVAASWRDGLAAAGVDAGRRARAAAAPKHILTPGSTAGVPLNILGDLRAPAADAWTQDEEGLRDEIQGLVSGILTLAGLPADPLEREAVLLANLVEASWRAGRDTSLAGVIDLVQRPPMRKLGVLDLDTFYPPTERADLALRLNTLLAAPSFAPWLTGAPLDVAAWLAPGARATVVAVAHLTEAERMSVVTVVLSHVVAWMRTQPGTGGLRALVYMDELFGFAPPTAEPPSKKPLLTLMKQARAYGVGIVVSTQNPVDLDYKAMSNAGTWCIGRLQTERDKARVLEGLASVRGDADVKALDHAITGLGKRQFLLHSVHLPAAVRFTTRWAMSYLRGPLALPEVARLTADDPLREVHAAAATSAAPATSSAPATASSAPGVPTMAPASMGADDTPVAPAVPPGVRVAYVDPAAPWLGALGGDPHGKRLAPALAALVQARFDDTTLELDEAEEWEMVARLDADATPSFVDVDYDARDFHDAAPSGASYVLPMAPVGEARFFAAAEKDLRDDLVARRTVTVWRNRALKSASRVGESRDDFVARMDTLAQARADEEAAKVRARLEAKVARQQDAMAKAQLRAEELAEDVQSRRQHELIAGAGDVLTSLLSGRRNTRSIVSRASRALTSASSRRGVSARTEQRLSSAETRVADAQDEVERLEQEITSELANIDARWAAVAQEVEEVPVGLEKTDVRVVELFLVWLPIV